MGDMVTVKEKRAVLSKKDALWKLANKLFATLSLPDPKMHEIFKYAPEITPTEFNNIYAYYDFGVAQHQKKNMQTNELTINSNSQINETENNNVSARQLHEQAGTKRQHRVTNNNEKKILENLLKYDNFPEDKVIEILRQL
ncbi:3637_t:CDS:2 [Dentiscutata heterogama]|uniref:3637_t:CDS:1 n=1 Tax=Dentiscutata heterogama TaxID=1316150 RepID=A0ACA9NG41_9GLOM|nr:3637_t:CDS:2 [Dentiscutata heterogama]